MAKKKPNLILFGIDSLRRDHMSLYGYRRLTTPHLDRFAAGGAVFENHFSPHIPTTPGYASMLTGRDCFGTDVVALRHRGDLGEGAVTLAEILRGEGYETACVGFTGNVAARGFDRYLDYEGWRKDETGRCPKADNLNRVTLPLLEELAAGDKPFFLFLRHMDPHTPYLPPPPFDRLFYGGDTLIVITSDHGETLNEHECYYDHHGLYESNLVTPLIIRFPGRVPEGDRYSQYTFAKDIVPTILELLEVDAGIAFDGLSLAALFKGGSLPAREEFYITECTWMRKHGWRTPKWKLVVALEPDFHGKPPVELYDLENDPLELENVAEIHPETVDLLKRRMEEHIAAREAATGRKNPMYTNTNWHGLGTGPFASSREAYEALRIRYLR